MRKSKFRRRITAFILAAVLLIPSLALQVTAASGPGDFAFATDLPPNVVANQNDPVTLSVEAINAANVVYDWFKDGKEIPRARVAADGKSFVIPNATAADAGVYQAKATAYTAPVVTVANNNFDSLALGRKLNIVNWDTPFRLSDLPPFGLSWANEVLGVTVVSRDGANNCL